MANTACSVLLPYIKDDIKESGTGRDSELIRYMNRFNRGILTPTLVRFRSDYGLTEWVTTETSANVRTVSLPTSFLAWHELYCIETFHTGTVGASGETSTITLASDASTTDDAYNGLLFRVTGGTADDQQSAITDYNGTTQKVTLQTALSTSTGSSDTYAIFEYPYESNRLRRKDIDFLGTDRGSTGMPDCYAVRGTNLELGYIPDDTYILWGWYYTSPTRMSATTDLMPYDPVFDELLMEYVSIRAENRDEYNVQMEAQLMEMFASEIAMIINERKSEVTNLELKGTEDL